MRGENIEGRVKKRERGRREAEELRAERAFCIHETNWIAQVFLANNRMIMKTLRCAF